MADSNILHLKDYDIVFDDSLQYLGDFLLQKKYSQVFILCDDQTEKYCLPVLFHQLPELSELKVITVPSGEQHKTLYTCEHIWGEMISGGADRKSVILNLGGGVIGDMGGFAAACFMRGIDFIQVPTTVLSQVDSSVGGKLGVDFKFGKNLIGAFKNPALVLISSLFLKSLPHRQVLNGFGEIFKHALIRESKFNGQWLQLEGFNTGIPLQMNEIVFESVAIKKAVVEEDPFEKHLRKILNFGHTIGHAIEAWYLQNSNEVLLHGEAIVVGMIMEAWLGTKYLNDCQLDMEKDVLPIFQNFYPKIDLPENMEQDVFAYMLMDKKNKSGKVLAVLLHGPGNPTIDVAIDFTMLNEAFSFYRNLTWN